MAQRPVSASLRRRRAAVRLGVAAAGALLGLTTLALVWPRADRSLNQDSLASLAELAKPPTRPVTVLVIGTDADHPADPNNGAAPAGPANSDGLLLLRVQPDGPLQLLALPVEAAVQLPGQRRPQALGSLYRQGGVALVGDAVRELLRLPPGQPDRYLVIGRGAVRQLVDDLGQLDLSPPRAMHYSDRRQNLEIALQAGLQRLDGRQVEHLLRYRDPLDGEAGRRQQQQLVLRTLVRELAQPARLSVLASIARQVLADGNTNLSEAEVLSLLVAGLAQPDAISFSELPLLPDDPRHHGLRELEPGAALPADWPSSP